MIRLGCLIFALLLLGIPLAAFTYLPWWGGLLVLAGEFALLLFGIPLAVKWGFKTLFMRLFGMKSAVLRGAKVTIHSIALVARPPRAVPSDPHAETHALPGTMGVDPTGHFAPPPYGETNSNAVKGEVIDPASPAEVDPPGTRYVHIDCTITPQGKQSSLMANWDVDDLRLVPYNLKISLTSDNGDESLEADPFTVKLVRPDGIRQELDGYKLTGGQRLDFVFRCPPDLKGRAKFRYYFETFGDLLLPS